MYKKMSIVVFLLVFLTSCSMPDGTREYKRHPSAESRSSISSTAGDSGQESTAEKTYTDSEIENALGNLQKCVDEFKPGFATYLSPAQSSPYKNSAFLKLNTVLHLYINIDDENHAYLCAGVEYTGKSWTFFNKLLFLADDVVYTIDVDRRQKSETSGSYVHEKYFWILSDDDIAIFEQLTASTKRKLKFEGKDNSSVYEFSDTDIDAITEILDAYKTLTQT